MKQAFIGKLVKYASSKTSTTTETALTPEQLAAGAMGVYGVRAADNKSYLLSPATATNLANGIILITDFIGTGTNSGSKVQIAMGVAVPTTLEQGQYYPGYVVTSSFDFRLATSTTKTKENEIPLKNWWIVGYDNITTTGSLNLPTLANGDTALLGIRTRKITSPEENVYEYDLAINASMSAYDVVGGLAAKLSTDPKNVVYGDVVASTGTELAPVQVTGSYTFTKGSPIIVNPTASASTIVVGDWLRIMNNQPTAPVLGPTNGAAVNTISAAMTVANSVLYKVIGVGTTGQTITLDRPYSGETQTITVANFNARVLRVTTLGTSLGLRIMGAQYNYRVYPYLGRDTDIQNATLVEKRGPSSGSGTYFMTSELEKLYSPYSGQLNKMDPVLTYNKPFPIYADPTCDTYDFYFSTVTTRVENNNIAQPAFTNGLPFEFATAFPTSNSAADDNQNAYDVIIGNLTAKTGDVVLTS